MKKILSFTLVLAMILGSVSFCFADHDYGNAEVVNAAFNETVKTSSFVDVTADDDCYAAVELLKAIGAVDGTSNGRFEPNYALTRAQVVAFIVKALGYPVTEGKAYVTKFADVPQTAWFAGYVYWGTTLGIVEGRTATKFDPNAKVSADEATAFILRTLGYTDDITGGYPAGYILAASKMTLGNTTTKFYDVISAGAATVTRGETAQLFNIIITKPFGAVITDSSYAATLGKHVGEFVVDEKKGTILDNAVKAGSLITEENVLVNLDLVESDAKNLVTICGKSFYTDLDLSAYLGASGTVYANSDKTVKANKIVAFVPATKFVTGVTKTGANDKTKWFIGGYEVDESIVKVPTIGWVELENRFTNSNLNTNPAIKVTYNEGVTSYEDKEVSGTTLSTTSKNTYAVRVDATTGKITEITSEISTSATYNLVIGETYKYVAPIYNEAKAEYEQVAYIGATRLPMVAGKAEIDYSHVELLGADKFEDIKADDVVTVYRYGTDPTGFATKVCVSSKKVTGILSEIDSTNVVVYINGEKIGYTKTTATGANAVAADKEEHTYYVNYAGSIVGSKDETASTTKTYYAVLLEAYNGVDAKSATLSTAATAKENAGLRLLTTDGTEKALYLDKKALDSKFNKAAYGSLLAYEFNKDGEIVTSTAAIVLDSIVGEVSKKGVVTSGSAVQAYLNSASVLFAYTEPTVYDEDVDQRTIADNYKVVPYTDVFEQTFVDGTVGVKNDDDTVKVGIVKLLSEVSTEDVYIFTATTKVVGATKYTALNLTDGNKYTFVSENSGYIKVESKSKDFTLYTVRVLNGYMTATPVTTTAAAIELDYETSYMYKSLTIKDDIVYLNTFTDAKKPLTVAEFVLDDDATVYEFTSKAVATTTTDKVSGKFAASTVDALNGVAATYTVRCKTVLAYDIDGNGEVELVIVVNGKYGDK